MLRWSAGGMNLNCVGWTAMEYLKTYQGLIKLVKSETEYYNHQDRSAKRNGFTLEESWNEAA